MGMLRGHVERCCGGMACLTKTRAEEALGEKPAWACLGAKASPGRGGGEPRRGGWLSVAAQDVDEVGHAFGGFFGDDVHA